MTGHREPEQLSSTVAQHIRAMNNVRQKDLTAIYKSVVEGKEKFQQQYDDETDYSRNKTKQEEWLIKIESELQQNKSWAGY